MSSGTSIADMLYRFVELMDAGGLKAVAALFRGGGAGSDLGAKNAKKE